MRPWIIRTAQALLAVMLLALLVIQALFAPLIAREAVCCEFAGDPLVSVVAAFGMVWLIVEAACVQVFLVIVWVLLSTVARRRIFDRRSLRLVTVMVWCALVFAALTIPCFAVLSAAQMLPGVVGFVLIGGFIGGIAAALVIVVMRELLATATRLNDEMSEVV
ncbi:DUF2975 domain-containing protein [Microbacterium halotolerans]|uniref:DUF2975 domain-containing protein n=1 Tax=Microbacterium halotolerans TaxID=246613 RepID=UPI000E6AB0BD|nr:DUF2975 domain-containing protein [Microbacterium halotolerans]